MTCAEIKTLIEIYALPDGPENEFVAKELCAKGLVEHRATTGYGCTPLGMAMVSALSRVPLPRQVFVDEHGKALE